MKTDDVSGNYYSYPPKTYPIYSNGKYALIAIGDSSGDGFMWGFHYLGDQMESTHSDITPGQ